MKVDPRAAVFKKGVRVRIMTDHFKGQNQCGTVLEDGDRARTGMQDTLKVRLDDVEKRRHRYYHWTSLEKLGAVDLLGGLVDARPR